MDDFNRNGDCKDRARDLIRLRKGGQRGLAVATFMQNVRYQVQVERQML